MATVTHTQITTPGDPYFSIANEDNATELRTVSGTSDGTTGDLIDLRCYSGGSSQAPNPGQDVPVNADGSFSVDIDLFDISGDGHGCILRAVPDNTNPDNTTPYAGPRMYITEWESPAAYSTYQVHGGGTVQPHWWMDFNGPTASSQAYDVSNDGLYDFSPSNPNSTLNHGWWEGYPPVEYGGALYQNNQDGDAASIHVDGHNAYTAGSAPRADYDQGGPEGTTYPTGVANPEVSITQDANGMVTVVEKQPLYFCQSADTYPPTDTSCPTVVPANVRLDRTLQSSDGGQTFTVTDNFVSTDGGPHTVGLNYYNEANNYNNYVVFQMPGEQDASLHDQGDVFNWQSAPATMSWFDSGDDSTAGAGALTELQKPDTSTWSGYYYWYQNFGSTMVPAGGSTALTHVYQVAMSRAALNKNTATQNDQYGAPTVAITSPADGTLTQSESVTVTGTAADNVGVKSLTVNGAPTVVGADGKWSQVVPLNEGQNTITAVATDGSGQSSQASIKVIRGASACRVPTVTGVTKDQAVAALAASGCAAGTEKQVFSGTVKKGSVVAQGAAPGTLLVTGTKVAFSVSRGAFPSATLKSKTAKLKGNRLIIAVRCASTGAATNGTIKLRTASGKKQTLDTKSFQCPSGKARNVIFTFTKKTASRLHKAGKTKVKAFIVSRGPDGAAASRTSNLTVKG